MDKNDIFEFPSRNPQLFELQHAGKRVAGKADFRHRKRSIDFWAMLIIERGCLYLRDGEQEHTLLPGQMILLRPGQVHEGFAAHQCDFYWLHFHCDTYQQRDLDYVRLLSQQPIPSQDSGLCIPYIYAATDSAAFMKSINLYLELFSSTGLYKLERLYAAFVNIIADISQDVLKQQKQTFQSGAHHVWGIIRYLKDHFTNEYAVELASREAQLNQDYANRLFKQHTGYSMKSYQIELRIEHARQLLEHEKLSVADVAAQVGYDDPYYFSRIFKKKCDLSPRQYRETIYRVRNE